MDTDRLATVAPLSPGRKFSLDGLKAALRQVGLGPVLGLVQQARTAYRRHKVWRRMPPARRAAINANMALVRQAPHLNAREKSFFTNEYQMRVETWRQSDFMDYPQQIHIETLARCNARCGFCPYPTLDRIGERMSDELFEKIINDLTEIPRHVPLKIAPFKVSDPLLEGRIFEMIRHIEQKLPNARLWMVTNGAAMNGRNIDRLAETGRQMDLKISLNDHRPDVYEELMGLPFARTYDNLKLLHAKKAAGEFQHVVRVGRVSGAQKDDKDFMDFVRREFPLFQGNVVGAGNWTGSVESRTHSNVLPIGCTAWFQFSIVATGEVALCCMDAEAEHSFGNVKERSVLEIYNSPQHRQYREMSLSRLDRAPCNGCTFPETPSLL